MLMREPPTTNAYSDDRNEEIRYLKWDLLRFLEPGDTKLLTLKTKTDIARLAACLGSFRNIPDALIDFDIGLSLLSATAGQIEQRSKISIKWVSAPLTKQARVKSWSRANFVSYWIAWPT